MVVIARCAMLAAALSFGAAARAHANSPPGAAARAHAIAPRGFLGLRQPGASDVQGADALAPARSDLAAPARPDSLPPSTLAVRDARGEWQPWWTAAGAPARWDAALPAVAGAVEWRRAADGVEWGDLQLAGDGEAWRVRAVLVRLDPRRVRFALDTLTRDYRSRGAWIVDSAPASALAALNAGQFDGGTPWGWTVREGRELQPPGTGPLSSAFVVTRAGDARIVAAAGLAAVRDSADLAFQSYPTLLEGDGEVPAALRAGGRGVSVGHRDARLAIGLLRDGRVLVLLTRFGAAGESLGALPFGPTVPELAALMGALGCARAVALDGGISAQLLVRDGGAVRAWRGMRRVPMGLVVLPGAAR